MTALMCHVLSSGARGALDRGTVLPRLPGAVQLCGPSASRPGSCRSSGGDDPAVLGDEAATEVRGVELDAPDRLVHRAQLGDGEGRADEGGRDPGDLELDPDAIDG